jgi:dTDP-glucose 4,6-dehydratase
MCEWPRIFDSMEKRKGIVMIIYVDIDNTILDTPKTGEYYKAKPFYDRIHKINQLYDNGNTIIYWTARGTRTGVDWRNLTETQLKRWSVKYHELKFGKPVYDLFIDDKNINSEHYFNTKE